MLLDVSGSGERFVNGQTAGPFTSGAAPTYLEGNLDWDSSYSSGSDWSGIGQKGARAFQTGSVLHIETPEGRHFSLQLAAGNRLWDDKSSENDRGAGLRRPSGFSA